MLFRAELRREGYMFVNDDLAKGRTVGRKRRRNRIGEAGMGVCADIGEAERRRDFAEIGEGDMALRPAADLHAADEIALGLEDRDIAPVVDPDHLYRPSVALSRLHFHQIPQVVDVPVYCAPAQLALGPVAPP